MRFSKDPFKIHSSLLSTKRKSQLDWEESAVDSQSLVEDLHDDQRSTPSVFWLKLLFIFGFFFLTSRVFYLQIIQGVNFRELSDNNRIRSQTILAPRGLILDRLQKILAQNTASYNLVITPFDLPKQQAEIELEVKKAADLFKFDPDKILKDISKAGKNSIRPIIVVQNLDQNSAILFQTRASEFLGFSLEQVPIRQYINSEIFSHTLGYTGLVSENDLKILEKDKYANIDFTGKSGIEQKYEKYLHGVNGQDMIEVDASGKLLNILGKNEPEPGQTLVLNLDKELQEFLYNELIKKSSQKSSAVAMNPKTGEILALVSLPGFDNNQFAAGISSENYKALLSNKNLPLFNRAIAGTYPPGSTVKPMVALAGLEEGVVNEHTTVVDNGSLIIASQFDPSVKYNFRGWNRSGLGVVDIYRAVAESSDIYFYQLAGGYPNSTIPKGLGIEKLTEYYFKFKLGNLTGIDIPGEKAGLVPTPEWKEKYFKNNPILGKWYLGNTYHVGIGQGDLLTTPLQVTVWTSAIANNGVGMVPKVLNKVLNNKGEVVYENKPEILFNRFAKEENIKIVQKTMRQTITSGSGRKLANLSIEVAGKTGTSQFDGSDLSKTHAWFTAYGPFNDPELAITVLVEGGGEGSETAVPVVRDAFKWWAENRNNK